MIDLHVHSTASDGTYTPQEIVELATKTGLSSLALTDHDTIAGLDEAKFYSDKHNLHFIPGIEISVDFRPGQLHILGLGLKNLDRQTHHRILTLQENRIQRNYEMIEKMKAHGFPIDYSDIEQFAGNSVVGRPHFARYFVRQGWCKSNDEAFQRYLGDRQIFHVPKQRIMLHEAIELINAAGGLAVLAHPLEMKINKSKLIELLPWFKENGVQAIETYHSAATKIACEWMHHIALQSGFLATAGSDFHGDNKKHVKLGRSSKSKIPINISFLPDCLKADICSA